MEKTIFEKIAQKEVPAYILDENEEFMAFLDNYPACYAQTLVIPKKQMDSYVFKHDSEFMNRYWDYIRSIALKLDQKLGSVRTVLMFEGFEVNHLHAKLYPFKSMEDAAKFNPRVHEKLNEADVKSILEKFNS